MPKLRILAASPTTAARNQKRGKLFEALMSDVLAHYGYRIDRIPNTNYGGMEIDIEGFHKIGDQPIYAECKCYESEVDSAKLQAFFGKFMSRWLKNPRSQGLFIAIPGINSHAKAFYRENCAANTQFTLRLLEEDLILDALVCSGRVAPTNTFSKAIPSSYGSPGEWNILVTEHGIVIIQWIIPTGSLVPTHIVLLDAKGSPITDRATIEKILELDHELKSHELILLGDSQLIVPTRSSELDETVVEVKGGTECFEFQFPAAPEHFVGRTEVIDEVNELASKIVSKSVSIRGVLFEANSGWGKSSCVLACANALRRSGHIAITIDSRSASSSQFIFRMCEYVAQHIDIDELSRYSITGSKITGFDGAADLLIRIGDHLKSLGKVGFIFLDQFENIFFLPDVFKRIRDLYLKVSSTDTNLAFGFCWKMDLVGLTNDFPYMLRDSIRKESQVITLSRFSEAETNSLLDRLSTEIRSRLRKDLRFFLSEFSQGYPWLLKKLCAHVKAQRAQKVSQAEMANGLLNVAQLFQEDLGGLALEEEDALRKIAKFSPVAIADLGEDLKPSVLQSLIDRRLIVRIGTKLDVYWDIFRDFLNTGKVPAQEQYLPRLGPRSVYRAYKILIEAGKPISYEDLRKQLNLSRHATYNVVHEIRKLGLAIAEEELVSALLVAKTEKELQPLFRAHLSEKLRRNRLVQITLDLLETQGALPLIEVSKLLSEKCPYISATDATWEVYAEVFCDWLDASGLATFDHRTSSLILLGQDISQLNLASTRRRGGVQALQVHYTPVESVARAFADFLRTRRFEWPLMAKSTREKAITTLEIFGFIVRTDGTLRATREMNRFLEADADYKLIFRDAAMELPSFKEFVLILEQRRNKKCGLMELGTSLRERLMADWSDGTAQTTAKILLDWTRHVGVAPGIYAQHLRRPQKQ